jgi:hypothetical protein
MKWATSLPCSLAKLPKVEHDVDKPLFPPNSVNACVIELGSRPRLSALEFLFLFFGPFLHLLSILWYRLTTKTNIIKINRSIWAVNADILTFTSSVIRSLKGTRPPESEALGTGLLLLKPDSELLGKSSTGVDVALLLSPLILFNMYLASGTPTLAVHLKGDFHAFSNKMLKVIVLSSYLQSARIYST